MAHGPRTPQPKGCSVTIQHPRTTLAIVIVVAVAAASYALWRGPEPPAEIVTPRGVRLLRMENTDPDVDTFLRIDPDGSRSVLTVRTRYHPDGTPSHDEATEHNLHRYRDSLPPDAGGPGRDR